MVNALTRKTGLTLGPIILETLVKHYFERLARESESEDTTRLRKEELLYDEAFNIIKVSDLFGICAPRGDARAGLNVASAGGRSCAAIPAFPRCRHATSGAYLEGTPVPGWMQTSRPVAFCDA